jgi:hypothetical protein
MAQTWQLHRVAIGLVIRMKRPLGSVVKDTSARALEHRAATKCQDRSAVALAMEKSREQDHATKKETLRDHQDGTGTRHPTTCRSVSATESGIDGS